LALTMTVQAPHWPSPQPIRSPQLQIIGQHIEQRGRRVNVQVCVCPLTFSVIALNISISYAEGFACVKSFRALKFASHNPQCQGANF